VTTATNSTPVLIVGGGYSGLASSLFLAHHGVHSILVDRHPGVSVQGRARGINQRTLEIYRPLGIESPIKQAGQPFDGEAGVVRCETLAGDWQWILDDATRTPLPDVTPCEFGMADQRTVEPILIDAAREKGADIRFGTRCVSVEADADGVTAVIKEHGGQSRTVRSDYLIAADGFRGTIGPGLGIARRGPGVTQHWVTMLFEADLRDIVRKRAMFWIVINPELDGFGSFLTTSVENQWAISVTYDGQSQSAADFTPDRCARLARAIIGRDVPVRILDIASWEEAVGVVDHYRRGRVFLTGDAAHVWPPAGAMGANAAVQDAHNLTWKLAAVLNGWAADRLLDTYDAERRPVAEALADITVRRQQARFAGQSDNDDVDDILCTLGQRYQSRAVLDAGHTTVYGAKLEQRALPGTRAPHLWLGSPGGEIAVHDLFHDAFVLLTGTTGTAWTAAARAIARQTPVPLRAYRVGPGLADVDLTDRDGNWAPRYGTGDTAVLVRPDGYVAWACASPSSDPTAQLSSALGRLLGTLP
jgi:putative polyketide hydroxylase